MRSDSTIEARLALATTPGTVHAAIAADGQHVGHVTLAIDEMGWCGTKGMEPDEWADQAMCHALSNVPMPERPYLIAVIEYAVTRAVGADSTKAYTGSLTQ